MFGLPMLMYMGKIKAFDLDFYQVNPFDDAICALSIINWQPSLSGIQYTSVDNSMGVCIFLENVPV
jgi:hypothetical protein